MSEDKKILPNHVAIIMDGNRRWAKERNLKVSEGHKRGAETLEKIASYCNKIGIKYLTVYAFSTENWKRSEEEVGALMSLLRMYLDKFSKKADTQNIVIKVLGELDDLEKGLQLSIKKAIQRTANNTGLVVNIALNYGGRAELTRAMKKIAVDVRDAKINAEEISESTIENNLYTAGQPDPDILIRTSGEIRLSNFLPWQLVYSEFCFLDKYWPDMDESDIDDVINIYQKRNRKFGGK